MSQRLTTILIWVLVVGAVFAFLWWKGYLVRLSNYVQQTKEELRKCTWPTWEELKGSTALVAISIIALGVFTMVVDYIFVHVVHFISKV
ncbi:MAG: preprotein translocase subunit SecE [Verrucomicrobiota bacterium]